MWPERRHFTGVGSSSPKAQPPSRQDLGGQSLRQGSDTLGYHFRITGGIPPITLSPWRHWVSPPRSCRPGTWARLPLGISSSALTSCGKVRVSGQGRGRRVRTFGGMISGHALAGTLTTLPTRRSASAFASSSACFLASRGCFATAVLRRFSASCSPGLGKPSSLSLSLFAAMLSARTGRAHGQ